MNKKIITLLSLLFILNFAFSAEVVHCWSIPSMPKTANASFTPESCAVSGNYNVNGTNYTWFVTPGAKIKATNFGTFNYNCDDGASQTAGTYATLDTGGALHVATNASNKEALPVGLRYCEGSGESMHQGSVIGYGNQGSLEYSIGTNLLGGQSYKLNVMNHPLAGHFGDQPYEVKSENYFVGTPSLLVLAPTVLSENFDSKNGFYEKEIFFTLVNKSPLTNLISSYKIQCPAGINCTIDNNYSDKNWPIKPLNGVMIISGKVMVDKNILPTSFTVGLDLNYTVKDFNGHPYCQQYYFNSTKSVPTTLNFGLLDQQDFQVKLKSDYEQTNCIGEDGMIGQTGEKYAPRVNLVFGGTTTGPRIDIDECSAKSILEQTTQTTTYLLYNEALNQDPNYPACPCDTSPTTQDCVSGDLTDGVSTFSSTTLVSGNTITVHNGTTTATTYTGKACTDKKVIQATGDTRYDGYITQGTSEGTPTGPGTAIDNPNWVFCSQKEFLVMTAARIGKVASLREQIARTTDNPTKLALALEASRYATFEAAIRTQDLSQASIDAAVNQINDNAAGNMFSNLGLSRYLPDNSDPINQYARLKNIYKHNGVTFNISSAKAGTYRFEIDINGLSEFLTDNYLFDTEGNLNSNLNIKVKATPVADPSYNWFFYENGNIDINNSSIDSTGATSEQVTNISKRGILLEFTQSPGSVFTSAKLYKTFALPLFIRLSDNNGEVDTNISTVGIYSDPFTYWTGFASSKGTGCETIAQNTSDTFLPYRLPDTKKAQGNAYYLPEFAQAKQNSAMYLETVLYYPLNNSSYSMITPFKVFTKNTICDGNSQTKCTLNITSDVTNHDMNSLETVFNGIKNGEVCVYKTVSNNTSVWSAFWNQQKILSDLNTMKRTAINDANICEAREALSG